jgi:hypothetical protein
VSMVRFGALSRPARLCKPATPVVPTSAAEPGTIGAVAQLVAHLHGMQGVRGSSPLSSTKKATFETPTREKTRQQKLPPFSLWVFSSVGVARTCSNN